MVSKIQFMYTISSDFNILWTFMCYHYGKYVPGFNNKTLYFVHTACLSISMTVTAEARGGVVVKALRYKPAGRGFDSQ